MPTSVGRRGRFAAVMALVVVSFPLFATDPTRPDPALVIERMKKDLFYLAGPECAGRASGSKEIDKAADYVAAAFKAAGLKPAGKDGSWFQPFAVAGRSAPAAPTSLKLAGPDGQALNLKYPGQFTVTTLAAAGKASGGVVFAGYGITSDTPAYDDYKGIDVKGKIVIILRRTPKYAEGSKNPFGADGGESALLQNKLTNAIRHGAAGLIFVNDKSLVETEDPLMEYQGGPNGSGFRIPVLHVKRYVLDHLLQATMEKNAADVEKLIDGDMTPRSAELTGWTANSEVALKRNDIACKNVVGYLEGNGPLADETIVIGAHYDHMGDGTLFFGSLGGAAARGKIHFGADDNGSGTTGVIELARRFGAIKDRQGRRIVFITFSAEERGLFGSAAYCREPLFPLDKTVFMLNMDMIGRSIPVEADDKTMKDRLIVWGTGTGEGFKQLVATATKTSDLKITALDAGTGPSDHDSFYRKKVPILFFYTGTHNDYHRPGDTPDKINYSAMRKVVDLGESFAGHFATVAERPKYLETKDRWADPTEARRGGAGAGRGFTVTLGLRMSYEDEGPGILLEGVTADAPAAKAGLKEGDRIIEMAGKPIANVGAYTTMLGSLKAGQEIDIKVVRKDKKEETLKITPQATGAR